MHSRYSVPTSHNHITAHPHQASPRSIPL
jgi:hypothetical protein